MAEGRDTAQESTCSVCLESFQEPKVLPCCHSFCLKCLEGTLDRAKDKSKITCPQCREKHQVPPNGAQGFLEDYTLAKQDTQPKVKGLDEPLCDHCEETTKAVRYCPACSKYLCTECLTAHNRLTPYRYHETVSATSKEILEVKQQAKKSYQCSLHPDEHLKLYCKKCQCMACILCFVSSHNGHDIGSVDGKTKKDVQKVIEGLITEADSKLTEFKQSLQYISAVEKAKSEQLAPLKAEIDKKVDSLIAQLEARRTELHKEVDDAKAKDQKELWAQKEYHETNIVSLKGALSFARRSLTCHEDIELLALNAQITSRLKELSQLKWESQSTEKVEITKMEFKETHYAPLSETTQSTQSHPEPCNLLPESPQPISPQPESPQPISPQLIWPQSISPQPESPSYSSTHHTRECYPLSSLTALQDPKLVGVLHTTASEPILQLTSDLKNPTVETGCCVSFQITADILITRKRGYQNAKITGSATYKHSQQRYTYKRTYMYDGYHENANSQLTVEKDANANSWTVTFTPRYDGTYQIIFTAAGQYGNRAISSTHYSDLNVYESANLNQDEPVPTRKRISKKKKRERVTTE